MMNERSSWTSTTRKIDEHGRCERCSWGRRLVVAVQPVRRPTAGKQWCHRHVEIIVSIRRRDGSRWGYPRVPARILAHIIRMLLYILLSWLRPPVLNFGTTGYFIIIIYR